MTTKTDWKNDASVLAHFRNENARGRRVLERMGVILSERVVRVPVFTNSEDIFVEVETPFATCAFVLYSGHAELEALVMKGQDQALLNGTWRKRGHIVGHAVSWIESKTFANGKAIKRGSKKVLRSCPATAYTLACAGSMGAWEDKSAAMEQYRKVIKEVEAELAIEHAQKTLADHGATVTG